jgi:phospholipid/cholesterol/gamma-HCH transport system substrate-binding protein
MTAATAPKPLVPRRFRDRVSPFRIGVLAFGITIVFVYLAFSKALPWQHPFELNAVFESSNNLAINSPVRIAGVDVGKVTKVERAPGTDMGKVTMKIDKNGLPIHKDANMKIRSRLFLEGNFFVDLSPGTPEAPKVKDKGTIPVTQTATPVQLDQVLTALQRNDRANLQDLLQGLGDSFERKPTASENATQDRLVKGKTAAQALNLSLLYAPEALKNSAEVNQALLGTEPDDLAKLVAGAQKVTSALAQNEEQLKDFVTNFNRFTAIFANQESSLRQAIALLGPTVESANQSLTHLNAALPAVDQFARNLTPVVEQTQQTIAALKPWIVQTRALVSPAEGGGLLAALRPVSRSLAATADESIDLFTQVNRTSLCFSNVILPAGNQQIRDAQGSSGVDAYKEFWYAITGFGGSGQDFDGNGSYLRTASGGGGTTIGTQKITRRGKNASLYGQALAAPLGAQPVKPSKEPPYKLDSPCYKNKEPDLNGEAAKPGPGDTVIP